MAVGTPPHAPPHGPPLGGPPPGGSPPAAASKPFDPKLTGIVFAVCAVAILIGVFTKAWATGRGGRIGVGPLGVEICFGSICKSASLDEIRADGDIVVFGYLSLIAGIAAAAVAGLYALFLLQRRRDKLPKYKLGNIAFSAGAFAMAFFAVRLLFEKETTIGWSPIFGVGGVVVAGIFLRKLKAAWPEGATVPASWGNAPHHGSFGGPPMGAPPMGAPPMGAPPMGAPPMGAPPMGAPMQNAPWQGAPNANAPNMGAPNMGAPPMGAPNMGAPNMGAPPMGAPNMGAPAMGAPMQGPPMGAPMQGPAMGAPAMGAPMQGPPMGAPARPPAQSPPMAAPAQPPAQPAQAAAFCPRCGAPMTFVAQYQRWFCERCRQYA